MVVRLINQKVFGNKRLWLILNVILLFACGDSGEVTKDAGQNNRYPSRDLNRVSPEFKPSMSLIDQPARRKYHIRSGRRENMMHEPKFRPFFFKVSMRKLPYQSELVIRSFYFRPAQLAFNAWYPFPEVHRMSKILQHFSKTAVPLTRTIPWDTKPSNLAEVYRSFVRTYYLLLQVRILLPWLIPRPWRWRWCVIKSLPVAGCRGQ
jgi:hypothetical protein